jgi:hypothetical protein
MRPFFAEKIKFHFFNLKVTVKILNKDQRQEVFAWNYLVCDEMLSGIA